MSPSFVPVKFDFSQQAEINYNCLIIAGTSFGHSHANSFTAHTQENDQIKGNSTWKGTKGTTNA